MKIIVSSKIRSGNIQSSLGKPEYSYFFLLKEFLPALSLVGDIIEVDGPDEVDDIYRDFSSRRIPCFYLSFSPPYQTPVGLECPTFSVYAWEFDNFPTRAWKDEPRHDWRYVFQRTAGAITTSQDAARQVRDAMGSTYPVIALPSGTWNKYADLCPAEGWTPVITQRSFPFIGVLLDSVNVGFSADGLVPPFANEEADEPMREPVENTVTASDELSGATAPVMAEPAFIPAPRISLRTLLGATRHCWRRWRETMQLYRDYPQTFSAHDGETSWGFPALHHTSVSGIVYTTVLNPSDGRKNWIDLVTAFCWTFRDTTEATLILKMTHYDLEHYRITLMTLLSRLAPFKARVVVLHGFLADEQYRGLIAASDYYVNASSGEGLCLPLMEFLSAGKPAIAPCHTAMADYITPEIAFVLQQSREPTCWPHDPTGILSTHKYRSNWEALSKAFEQSHELALKKPQDYRKMSLSAVSRMKDFCSAEKVAEGLKQFFDRTLPGKDQK